MALATITSKRQLTIPSKVFKTVGFKKGDKVIVEEENGALKIKKATALVEELAGSVKVPKHLMGVDVDEAIRIAKQRRFSKNK
jgi:AbrB family looped-hinge helix DNA binding protein